MAFPKKPVTNIFKSKFFFKVEEIPPNTESNAAMIAITGYYKYLDRDFCSISVPAYSRVQM